MNKSHEDAYWPDNCHFLLSAVSITVGPKKQNYEKIWHP